MTKLLTPLLLLAVAIPIGTANAFVAAPPASRVHSSLSKPTFLSLSSSPKNNNYNSGGDSFLKARTDIRYFLTQRSIQSFVYLLNQCREEHSVRWLEKTLDFTSIDNFHGTGAFNQTQFPEWDSLFLDCVDRSEELMVMQIRSRRRQQRLSGYNSYFESMKQTQKPRPQAEAPPDTDSTASNTGTEETKGDAATTNTNTGGFSATSYLDNMAAPPVTSATKKSWQPPKKNSSHQRLSSASSYLENLSASTSASTPISSSAKKDPAKDGNTKPSYPTFGPARTTNYLENLKPSASTPASPENKNTNDEKTQQSTETSKNPYLEETITEYEFSVDPPALVRRILQVREQISKEWVEDLDMLTKLNDEITEFLEEQNAAAKEDEDEEEDDDEDVNTKSKAENNEGKSYEDDKDSGEMDHFLKSLHNNGDTDKIKRQTAFDRNILSSWTQLLWNPNHSSSHYRKANFDLLLLLATQESVHRVLKSYKEDDEVRPETHEWLLEHYKDNVSKYFDGHQTHARSEDFLEEMMKSPRTLIETNNEFLAWTDPAIVAEDIVRERSEVALDWMEIAETISEEHTDLRRMLFSNMVSKPSPDEILVDTIITAVNIQNLTATESSTEVFGAFE